MKRFSLLVLLALFLGGCSIKMTIQPFEIVGRKCEFARAQSWNVNNTFAVCDDKGRLVQMLIQPNRTVGETVGSYAIIGAAGILGPVILDNIRD